ncbi:MAG: sulfotransferase [Planctomycetes bacterium]|jgi:hypothetical protein|nr:sulfotransferase [Planctomycetota bacterium]
MTDRLLARLAAERPVVVMGRGHSGTRVLAWALEALGVRMGTLPDKQTGDAQDRRFTGVIKRLAGHAIDRPALAVPPPQSIQRFARAATGYLVWLRQHVPDWDSRCGWGFKFPEAYLIGPMVDAVFPRARHIHMVRDGRDLAFKEHLTDDASRWLGRRILTRLRALREPHHIQAARSWDFQVRRFSEFEKTLGPRVLRLTFERLIASPEESMRDVCAFLGLPMTGACRAFLARDLEPGKVRQHRTEDPEKVRAVEAIIGDTLEAWGYRREQA